MTGKKASAEEVNVSMKLAKLVIDPKTIGIMSSLEMILNWRKNF